MAKREAWLVKLPSFVAKDWKEKGNGALLGTLSFNHQEGRQRPTMTLRLPPSESAPSSSSLASSSSNTTVDNKMPQELVVVSRESKLKTIVFSETPISAGSAVQGMQGSKAVLEGEVRLTADAKPVFSKEYRDLLLERHNKSQQRTHVTQSLPELATEVAPAGVSGLGGAGPGWAGRPTGLGRSSQHERNPRIYRKCVLLFEFLRRE